jgi:TonB family protein
MKFRSVRQFPFVLILACGYLIQASGQAKNSTQQSDAATKSEPPLKLLKGPTVPFPEEALKENVEGKVELSLTVDAEGRVSDAKIITGPEELCQAALESVKQWQFEPPAHAPAETKAYVTYGHPKPCPGPVADIGVVFLSNRLTNDKGTIVEVVDEINLPAPHYYREDMRAGVAGDMLLSVSINANGKPTKIRVVHSLSPHLDKATIKTVRTWRFKLRPGSPGSLPDTFPLPIKFDPECHMEL